MRVLLIWPQNANSVLSDELSCCEPLPLEYLAGALKSRHDVVIHDLRLDPPLATLADGPQPHLVGLALPYTTMLRSAHQVAREIRDLWPQVPLVIGGHHPTMSTEWLMGLPADYAVVGEGGPALAELCDQIERHGQMVAPIVGVGRFEDLWKGITRPSFHSLEEIPRPDRTLLRHHHQHYFHSIYRPVALMRFSAGCPYKCTFCSLWRLTDRHYLTQTIPAIIEELQEIAVENIYVVDDEAFIQPQRMLLLADAIEQAGIKKRFHMYLRTDTTVRRSDVVARWREVGLDSVLVGAESLQDDDLDEYDKGAKVDQTKKAVAIFHDLNIKVRANFIVKPNYSRENFRRLAQEVAHLGIDMPSFSVLCPLPGTQLYEETHQTFISDNPDLFDCYHTLLETRLPLHRFYEEMAQLLAVTSARKTPGINSENDPSVFYYSHSGAFQRMLDTVRQGHHWNAERWQMPAAAALKN